MAAPLFAFAGVTVRYGDREILRTVDLEVPDGGVTILTGPSGAGKTSLLRLCNRLDVPSEGEVSYRGTPLDSIDPLALRRRVGMVFQRPTLFPGTVRENFDVACPGASDEPMVAALERAGLDGAFLDRTGDDLSGGEAQRVCLARTLVTGPEALLVDEPTSSLDPLATFALERSIVALARSGVPVVWVSHDRAQARRVGDRHVVLVEGALLAPDEADRYVDEPA
jgi:putative ABC transport system ATP-binding protein